MKNCSFFILLIFILAGCSMTKGPAPIEYNHNNTKQNIQEEPTNTSKGEVIFKDAYEDEVLAEIITPYNEDDYANPNTKPTKPTNQEKKIIYHEVGFDETIEDIALEYKQTAKDIASLNKLSPPYYLEELQILKIKVDKNYSSKTKVKQQTKAIERTPDFIPPVKGKIISRFGEKTIYGKNKGINIASKSGTKVLSSNNGRVIYADYDAIFGYLVIIKATGKNIVTSYAHLEDIVLSKGASIKQGDVIGYVGDSGKVTTPQLHFGIREGKTAKDPLQYLNF